MNDILADCRCGAGASHSRKLCGRPIPSGPTDSRPAQPAAFMSSQNFDRRRILKGALASAVPLALGACAGDKNARRDPLVVGGLPVTCNLTLPVACTAKDASLKLG